MKKILNIKLFEDDNILLNKKISYLVDNNIISFFIDDMKNTIDLNKKTLIRENDEYIFTLDITNKKSTIKLKKEKYLLQLKVEYAILLTNQNIIEISYCLETHQNNMKLLLELEGESKIWFKKILKSFWLIP